MQIKGANEKKYGVVDVLLMLGLSVELHGTCEAVKATGRRLLEGLHALTEDAVSTLKSIVESGDSIQATVSAISVWEPDGVLMDAEELGIEPGPTVCTKNAEVEAAEPPKPVEVTFGFGKKAGKPKETKPIMIVGAPRPAF